MFWCRGRGANVVVVYHSGFCGNVEVVWGVGIPCHALDVAFNPPAGDVGGSGVCGAEVGGDDGAVVAAAQEDGGIFWVPGYGADFVSVAVVGFCTLLCRQVPELYGFVGRGRSEKVAVLAVCSEGEDGVDMVVGVCFFGFLAFLLFEVCLLVGF